MINLYAQHKILLIEDDESIIEMVSSYLSKEGFMMITALDGEQGIQQFAKGSYDVIIVDLMMPKLDGIEVIKQIRLQSAVPILIMSAKDSDVDKALGLGFGADDYIAKPFSMIELCARVKAAIRRATQYSQPEQQVQEQIITVADLQVDVNNYVVRKNGIQLHLTSKEFEIMRLLISNPKRVFTKAQIYNIVWQDDYFKDENVINVHMRRLREKIEDAPSNPKHIKTIWGIGYKWEDE